MTEWLKVGTKKREKSAVARQRPVNDYDAVFSMRSALVSVLSVLRLYNEDQRDATSAANFTIKAAISLRKE